MEVQFDSGELEGNKYLGEGTYICTISKIDHRQSKAKGDPMIEVEFTAENGKSTRDWFMLAGNKFKLGGLAIAAGFKKEALLSGKFRTESLQGKRLKVVREAKGKETYLKDGEQKERTIYENSYLQTEGNAATAASDDDIPF